MERKLTERQLEIVNEIRRIAKLLDVERLSSSEFDKHHQIAGVSTAGYQFGSWNRAVKAAGLKPYPTGGGDRSPKFNDVELLEEVIRVHKELGKQPSEREFSKFGKFSIRPYIARWGTFKQGREQAYKVFGRPEDQTSV